MPKRKIANMNYPDGVPPKDVERFWGKPRKADRDLLKNVKVRKHNEPSPV